MSVKAKCFWQLGFLLRLRFWGSGTFLVGFPVWLVVCCFAIAFTGKDFACLPGQKLLLL